MANEIVPLVVLMQDEPRSSSWRMKDGFGVEHRALTRLIKKYRSEFEEFGEVITTELQRKSKSSNATALQRNPEGSGGVVEEYWLNEEQAFYLGTLLTNSDRVRQFKRVLVKDYARCKRLLQQRQNAEWIEARNSGKRLRRQETDAIKTFIDYAKSQGSQSAEKYYVNISKMENKALFLVEQKYPNLRDVLGVAELGLISVADTIVANALAEGIQKAMHYKDIYKLAKERVEALGLAYGKVAIPTSALTKH
jgi:phage regulator Rha-like protein